MKKKKKKQHGGARKGAGRPPKAPAELQGRSPHVPCRVSAAHLALWRKGAAAQKATLRAQLEAWIVREYGPVVTVADLR